MRAPTFEFKLLSWNAMSQSLYIQSKHAFSKVLIQALGFVATVCSYYSYTDSPWSREGLYYKCREHALHGLKTVKWKGTANHEYEMSTSNCSGLIEERALFWCNIFFLASSVAMFVGCCLADIESVNELRHRDTFLHILSALVLLIFSIVQIIAVSKIKNNRCNVREEDSKEYLHSENCSTYLQLTHKFAAAGVTIALAAVYVLSACVIENTRLYGMDAPRVLPRTAGQSTGPSILTGAAARRRSSCVSVNSNKLRAEGNNQKKAKAGGLGGFGAVSSNRAGDKHVPVNPADANDAPGAGP